MLKQKISSEALSSIWDKLCLQQLSILGWQILGMRRAGFTQNEISRDLNIRQGTVSKILRRHSQRRTVKLNASQYVLSHSDDAVVPTKAVSVCANHSAEVFERVCMP
jgi:IS30 family transposase